MKNKFCPLFIALFLLALLNLNSDLSTAFAQGSLTPPGAPAPTMKTLSQIEPRTPISSLPYTITNPGCYYLTTNLSGGSSADGIDIKTNGVTLDLEGFTLQGVNGGTGYGINVLNSARNLAIRNGVLDSWGSGNINAGNSYNSQFERLRISNAGSTYNGLVTGSNCLVLGCNFMGNAYGIQTGNNCIVKDCTATGNTIYGMVVGNNCTLKDCTASANPAEYYGMATGNNCTVSGCTVSGNGTYGMVVQNNCTVNACTVSANGSDGIDVGSDCTVKDCTASHNTNDGINVSGNNCLVTGNTCSGNGALGIEIAGYPNRIDGNFTGYNYSFGISPDALNVTNCITRNSSPGPGYGNTGGNNDYAPVGKPNTSTNPWANFQ